MNLKECKGKVPVYVGGVSPYKLVDFPSKPTFDLLFKSSKQEMRDKYWTILQMRAINGSSLSEVGKLHGVSRERIRQIEAKFLRKVAISLRTVLPEMFPLEDGSH